MPCTKAMRCCASSASRASRLSGSCHLGLLESAFEGIAEKIYSF
jgi:hypothetical protein